MTWDDSLPENWATAKFEEIVQSDAPIIYGIIQPGENVVDGVPYVRPVDVIDGQIVVGRLPKTAHSIAARYRRSTLKAGDVVLSIVGTIGKVALVPSILEGANITQTSVRIRPVPEVSNEWVRYALRSPQMVRQFKTKIFGLGLQRLNVAHVRELELPLASAAEQQRVVEKLDAIFKAAAAARSRLTHALQLVDELEQAALTTAFRGELVPANASDELGSMILERIRATRATAARQPRAKKARASKAVDSRGAPLDLVVAAFQQRQTLTLTSIAQATGLGSKDVKQALKALGDGGRVTMRGRGPRTTYDWSAG